MNQRSSFSRSRENKSDKSSRNRQHGEEEVDEDDQQRRLAERSSYGSRYYPFEKSRPRDEHNSLVFRRQERGKFTSRYGKIVTPETSPGRLSSTQSDIGRHDTTKYGSTSGSTSHYRGSQSNFRDKDYPGRRSEHASSRIFDDARLLNFLSRISRDEDRERQSAMIRQLKDIFAQHENFKVVVSNLKEIIATFDDLLLGGYYSEYKQEIISSLGTLGAVLGIKAKSLLDWIFRTYKTAKSDDVRVVLFKSLNEMLKSDKDKMNLADLIPNVMSNVQSALEVADIPALLMPSVDVIFEISNSYPEIFSSHFTDTVDILIGWHIDTTQLPAITNFTSQALINLKQYWLYDINFTLTLLGQFLEDMGSYAEKLSKYETCEDIELTPAENVSKIHSLVRVLTTVLKSIGNILIPDDNGPYTWNFLCDMMKNFIGCILMTMEYYYNYDLVTSANDCLCLLLRQLQFHTIDVMSYLESYIDALQFQDGRFLCEQHILSTLGVMTEFVRVVDSYLPVGFVGKLFNEASLLRQLRCSQSMKVQQHMIALMHAILNVKNVHAVEELYKSIISDIEESVAILSEKDAERENANFKRTHVLLLFSLSSLVEIGNAKHSIIRMWALKPSFFELMTEKLKPTSKELVVNCPSVQYAIVFTLYSHSQRHKHFISSSSLIHRSHSLQQSTSGTNSPILANVLTPTQHKENLSGIMVLLNNILGCPETSYDCRLLCLQWALELVQNVGQNLVRMADKPNFKDLIHVIVKTAYDAECVEVCKLCGQILLKILQCARSYISQLVFQSCFELALMKINSYDEELQTVFSSILVLLPIHVILSGYPNSSSVGASLLGDASVPFKVGDATADVAAACHLLMSKVCHGSLTNHHFKTITNFVLLGLKPEKGDWLQRIFYSCPPSVDPSKPNKLTESCLSLSVGHSSASLWFWAMWEVAQMCILCKLRTPLGKPQETFMAIEGALKSYIKPSSKQKSQTLAAKKHSLLRVNLLLALMENLEKLLYNAYEGCAYALPSGPKTVRTFFRTNKNTCLEWLFRVRMTISLVALNAGQPALSLRNAFELLLEMKNSGKAEESEFGNILYIIVKALIQLRCPEAIVGIYKWCKDKIGQKLVWMRAAVHHAGGRFETAVQEYASVLHLAKPFQSPMRTTNKNLKEITIFNEKLKNGTLSHEGKGDELIKILGHKKELTLKETDVRFQSFLMHQITECYVSLGSWSDVCMWVAAHEKVKFNQNGNTTEQEQDAFFENVSYLRALSVFEDSASSSDLDFGPCNFKNCLSFSLPNWNVHQESHSIEKLLLRSAMEYESKSKLASDVEEMQYDIVEAKSSILQLLKTSALDFPPHIMPQHSSLLISAAAFESIFHDEKAHDILLDENMKFDASDYCCSTLMSLLSWQHVQSHLEAKKDGVCKSKDSLVDLLVVTARLARKQQNLKLSQKLLLKSSNCLFGSDSFMTMNSSDLSAGKLVLSMDSLKSVLKKSLDLEPSKKTMIMQREGAKLLHAAGDVEGACDFLLKNCLSIASKINKDQDSDDGSQNTVFSCLRELNSRSLLNIVRYMQQDTKNMSDMLLDVSVEHPSCGDMSATLNTIVKIETIGNRVSNNVNGLLRGANLECESIVGETDFLIGRLLLLGVHQCPSLAKAWCAYASWCYRWGRKVIDIASTSCMNLLPEEESNIHALVPNATKEEVASIMNIITCLHRSSSGEWDNQERDFAEQGADETHQQLISTCPFLTSLANYEEVLQVLVEVWQKASDRTYSYYKMAAQAYLEFLQINGTAYRDHSEDDNVTATLRLLRLVVKHASELRDVLEDGLARTPTAPWRGIIPQLFSRLNHPEPYVRQSISDLLCRVAQASPHLIVFPAVVGSLTLKAGKQIPDETSNLFKAYFAENLEGTPNADSEKPSSQLSEDPEMLPSSLREMLTDEDDETEEDSHKTAIMQNCFAALVETLGRSDGRTISEVKNLVHELHRITLLWDELWLGTLNLHHSEVNRRITHLEKEIMKVSNNHHLSKEEKIEIIQEKHNVYIMPTIFVLEQLQIITSQTAETPHEQWFQKTFEKHINHALEKLRNPSDPSKPQETWTVFKKLHQLFQQKLRQIRSPMQMEDISPVLAGLKSSVIPMPGIKKKGSTIVTVQSVSPVLTILPTKTKPKKIAFLGSDGNKYGYLFKGLEDLHLDERIMQFLSIVNNMFAKNKIHGKEIFNARHYSVTPLGPRSGLIQWVDGATPLFSLYKKWQQREAVASTIKGQALIVAGNILRPSDIYYNKLTPLLKEKGINNLENRKEWPLSIQLEVLKELMDETPNDLLSKELWCHCSSASQWWNVTQSYNHSTAVMSVIGYVIGLGDRHLDNVLVDLVTGEVVHIDYNVCFEKGKNLRVPEKVPFRMTPNIETALGITGVEGMFRVSCEHVLKVLRKGRETLLTLLEAFVYDPLVDWTPGNEGGYTGAMYGGRQVWAKDMQHTRQDMEADIACSMFCIRVTEMKGEWMKNRDDLLSTLSKLGALLDDWEKSQVQLQASECELQDACLQKALLEEAQVNPSHHLYTLPKRMEEITVVKTAVKAAQDSARDKLVEHEKWHLMHCEALSSVCGAVLQNWRIEAARSPIDDSLSVAPVIEFLQTAGQSQLVQQCEHLESELSAILQQQQGNIRACVELLATYATIVQQFGPAFREYGRVFKWKGWLQSLLENFTVSKCQEIANEAALENATGVAQVQATVAIHFHLQDAINDLNTKLHALYERQLLESVQDKKVLSSFLEESRLAVIHFAAGEGNEQSDFHLSLVCMFVTVFCGIYKRLIMMEKSASAAGNSFVDLTSWGGHWFLDEMCGVCANVSEFARLLLDCWTALNLEMKSDFSAVQLSYCVFQSLEDLSVNFQNIILPEAIQRSQEPTVLEMVSKLDRIIARSGAPLDRLISELESNARSVILGSQVTETWVNDVVKKLRNEFESLMKKTEPHIPDLNQGQMLLMGFNGLFTKIDSDFDMLLAFLDSQCYPNDWKKLDIFRDTVAFAPFVHNHSTRTIMKDIYFVQKLLVIQQFFHHCQEYVSTLLLKNNKSDCKNSSEQLLLMTEYHMVKPIKLYTAEYVRNMVLGLPSQALGLSICALMGYLGFNLSAEIHLRDAGVESQLSVEDIAQKAIDICINEHYLSKLPGANDVTGNFDAAWRQKDATRRLEQNLLTCKNSLQRVQLQLTRFQWLHEDVLVMGSVGPFSIPTRSSVMSEMRKVVQTLVGYEANILLSQDRYLNVTSGIEQRLKWATGANPSLTNVQEEFEAAIAKKTGAVTNMMQFTRELVDACNGILHFEALRTRTTESLSADTAFLTLITRCQESCLLAESCNSQISSAEEHLVILQPLPEVSGITNEWMASVMEKVSHWLSSCREILEQKKSASQSCLESLNSQVSRSHLHDLLTTHRKLMSEVRQILRNLAKHEEQEQDSETRSEASVLQYIALHKKFSENILLSKLLSGKDFRLDQLNEIKAQIPSMISSVSEVYDKLMELAGAMAARTLENQRRHHADGAHRSMSAPEVTGVNFGASALPRTTQRGTPVKKTSVSRDPRTGKALQERNSYATNVWKRVKMKLDGRDPDSSRKATVAEQIDFIIKEATSQENLAVLYEGWTPWV